MASSVPTIAVIGLGGLGSATAWFAQRSGAQVLGFEQFELGHVRGASHDTSRIIRHSYHTPHYVQATFGAYDAWAEVEAASGRGLVTVTGGVDLFPPGAAIDAATYRSSLSDVGVDHEWVDGAEVRRRWPGFAVADEVMGLCQGRTGIVPAGPGTATLQQLAVDAGAQLRANCPVRALEPSGSGVDVVVDDGTVHVDAVLVTADAWADRLLSGLGIDLPLQVTREQVTYLSVEGVERYDIGRFPVWIWMDDPSFYGFPVYGRPGVIKVAEDCGGPLVDPDTRTFEPDPVMEQRLVAFSEGLFGIRPAVEHTVTCLYTMTSDRDFVLDRVPDVPQISVGLGAAHGFKFAPWFGRHLAALALGAERPQALAPFGFDRPSLYEAADRERWLV